MIKRILSYYKKHGLRLTLLWLYGCFVFKFRNRKIKSSDFACIDVQAEQAPFLTKKDSPTVFIMASDPYYAFCGEHQSAQKARAFNAMGYNVQYFYAVKPAQNVRFNIPVPVSAHLLICEDACNKINAEATEADLFVFEAPCREFGAVLDIAIAKNAKIFYQSNDDDESDSDNYDTDIKKRLLYYSIALERAVDDELFSAGRYAEKPEDLARGRVTLIYYGSLSESVVDWSLLASLAKEHPEYSINIIGDSANFDAKRQELPQNICFLGIKRQVDLPAYLKYADYAIIPFKTDKNAEKALSGSVLEYISMHKRVLSTKLSKTEKYPNVFCGETAEQWACIIEKNVSPSTAAADDFVLENSWRTRVTQIIDAAYPQKENSLLKDKLSVVVLNYNNKNVIFRCINTILKFNQLYNCEIIVVDNGSTDGSYELLEQTYKNGEITLVKNSKNGCSSGRNLGVAHSKREYIMFLDSDQWVNNKYWLQPYEQILQKNKNVGLIGWAAGFFNRKKYACHVVDTFPYKFMPSNMLCRCDISYLGSGGMIISREDFDKIDGFDVYYDPTCYEDTDISLKVRNFGKEIYYCPYLGVYHLPHQTTNSGTKAHQALIKAKGDYFVAKWERINKSLFKFIK